MLLTTLALFCLLVSYYLIKPLRNSKFLEEFLPSYLPFVYSTTALLSFSVTKLFSHLARTVEKYRLVTGAYIVIIVCKLLLGTWLKYGGKPAVVCFYFFASVYFLLAIATMWACINDIFTSEQSERCFGFIALGSTLGGILGSELSKQMANSAFSDYVLESSVIFMIAALFCVLAASRSNRGLGDEPDISVERKAGFFEELRALVKRSYLRHIAATVLLLAVATTGIEFVTQTVLDREMARKQYETVFAEYQGIDFETVYRLKLKTPEERYAFHTEIAVANELEPGVFVEKYETYRSDLEKNIRTFYSETYAIQGIVGMVLLLVVARILFPLVGMRFCYVVLPTAVLTSFFLFALTVDLMLIQIVLVAVGALNYSFNNAAKEILYSATDTETLFRFKPMIEGPCMRAGDVLASILRLTVGALVMTYALDIMTELNIFLVVTGVLLIIWIRAAWLAGHEYDFDKRQRDLPRNN